MATKTKTEPTPEELKAKEDEQAATTRWKPLGQEFFLETDHAAIAQALGVEVDAINFVITDDERDGIAGHVLAGTPRAAA